MEILGFISAVIIGISLGLIGGGGSILTVPVLVYLLQEDPVISTAYSLFIVGTSALVGAALAYRKGNVDVKTGVIFGIPSIITVYITRKFIVPSIPAEMFSIGGVDVTKTSFIMLLFAVLMVAASVSMIRGRKDAEERKDVKFDGKKVLMILAEGVIVGVLTGLVGAGGGFLIIPALVLFSGLPMKTAVGTSLMIIATKSLIGFTGDLSNYDINWGMLLPFTGLAVGGIFLGSLLSTKIPGSKLKPAFGWFVLVMGVYMLIKEGMAM